MSNVRIMLGLLAVLSAVLCCLSLPDMDNTMDSKPMSKDQDEMFNDRVHDHHHDHHHMDKDHDCIDTEVKKPKRGLTNYNYVRLPEGTCYDGSTYKCTNQKDNLGGSEWCIMLFPAAITQCDSDPQCGGYAINTAGAFHSKYDRNGQRAVHLVKIDAKKVSCSTPEWSGYEKLKTVRTTPTEYGASTCGEIKEEGVSCSTSSRLNEYVFVSKSNVEDSVGPYLCKDNEKQLGAKDVHCILPMVDAVNVCNLDEKCDGFLISLEEAWEKQYSREGMQGVQLFGKGVKFTPNDKFRSFQKKRV